MTDPRILDSAGAVLAVGDPVEVHGAVVNGTVANFNWIPEIGWAVGVLAPGEPGPSKRPFHCPPDVDLNTFRCSGLTRITTEETN